MVSNGNTWAYYLNQAVDVDTVHRVIQMSKVLPDFSHALTGQESVPSLLCPLRSFPRPVVRLLWGQMKKVGERELMRGLEKFLSVLRRVGRVYKRNGV